MKWYFEKVAHPQLTLSNLSKPLWQHVDPVLLECLALFEDADLPTTVQQSWAMRTGTLPSLQPCRRTYFHVIQEQLGGVRPDGPGGSISRAQAHKAYKVLCS